MKDLAIVTFWWHDNNYKDRDKITFGVEHVEKLARSCKRHCTYDFDFVLVTDLPEKHWGEFKDVDRVVPLWDDNRDMGGCYVRLKAFDRETGLKLANKRFMWLDLDIVITGNIDFLFNHKHSFWSWVDVNPPTPYCGSLVGMDVGARQEVWDKFARYESKKQAQRYIGTDQAWIGHVLGPREKVFGRDDGVYSYKKHIMHREKEKYTNILPERTKMVVFHGDVDPSISKAQWVKENWI